MTRFKITVAFTKDVDLSQFTGGEGEVLEEIDAVEELIEQIESGDILLDEFSEGQLLTVTIQTA